ncbi:MAG: oxidoreductase [Chloroflexota bacterium]
MLLVLPLAVCWIGAVALAILDGRRPGVAWLSVATLAAAFACAVALAAEVISGQPRQTVAGNWPPGVGIVLRADALGIIFAVVCLGVLLAALSFEVLSGVRSRSYPSLVLFLAAGLTGLFLTGDAFNFYVFFEISMIASYVLTAYGEERRQLRAAAIFAVVNLLGSTLFLIGIAALYHVTGRLDFFGISSRIVEVPSRTVVLSATLIFVAFGVKLGLFPFHFWLAAVYTGTRPSVAAILSGAVANIGAYGLLRFGGELLPRELGFSAIALVSIGAASIVYGALQAISRSTLPEVLAYSSIGQAGYILVALGIGGQAGYSAAVLFAVVNSLNKALLFLSENLRGWLVGASFAIGAMSVAGVPPAAGFVSKAALFQAGIAEDSVALLILIFVGGSLSLVYMVQAYQRRFWQPDGTPEGASPAASPTRVRAIVVALAMLVIVLGVWPEPLLSLSRNAANVLPPVPAEPRR